MIGKNYLGRARSKSHRLVSGLAESTLNGFYSWDPTQIRRLRRDLSSRKAISSPPRNIAGNEGGLFEKLSDVLYGLRGPIVAIASFAIFSGATYFGISKLGHALFGKHKDIVGYFEGNLYGRQIEYEEEDGVFNEKNIMVVRDGENKYTYIDSYDEHSLSLKEDNGKVIEGDRLERVVIETPKGTYDFDAKRGPVSDLQAEYFTRVFSEHNLLYNELRTKILQRKKDVASLDLTCVLSEDK